MTDVFLFIALSVCAVSARTHSLKYFYVAVNGTPEDFPEFISAGFVDDIQIDQYDSQTLKDVPKQQWMEENLGSEHWNREKEKLSHSHQAFKMNVRTGMERTNQTDGVHTAQRMYGCELHDDGTTTGFAQDAFDGHDFISFDQKTLTWTAAMQEAVITKNKWDANTAGAQQLKAYLELECVEWLKRYVQFGNATLERNVHPKITVSFKKNSGNRVVVYSCLVTGFYPRDIDVSWVKNEMVKMEQVESSGILPNYDGTYWIRKWIEIVPNDGSRYSCHVEHSSMEMPDVNMAPIAGQEEKLNPSATAWYVSAFVVLLAAIVGVIVCRRKRAAVPGEP